MYNYSNKIFESIDLAKNIYNQLEKWEKIKLFDLGESPEYFCFHIGFCPSFKLSVSLVTGRIETTLVSIADDKLSHCDALGYNKLCCIKFFENCDDLKKELLRLYDLCDRPEC